MPGCLVLIRDLTAESGVELITMNQANRHRHSCYLPEKPKCSRGEGDRLCGSATLIA